MDYSGLKAGVYLQHGEQLTKLSETKTTLFRDVWNGLGTGQGAAEILAERVAWVYIALEKRRQFLLEIPHNWARGEEELSEEPFGGSFREMIQQIDTSMQLNSVAYILKQRGENTGAMIGLRWLDPNTMRPDMDTATVEEGIRFYIRTNSDGKEQPIPVEDLLVFRVPGMRELTPASSAANATKLAASIMLGVDQTATTLYKNNALPVMLVFVPRDTSENDRRGIQNTFRRLFNGNQGTQDVRTAGILEGVRVEPLSYAPKDLDQSSLTEKQVEAILGAHGVPKSVALSDAANYATATVDIRSFVANLGQRLEYIAAVVNQDPMFMAAALKLVVKVQEHYSMKEDEAQRADAFGKYLQGFTQEAAAFLVGIKRDAFPKELQATVFLDDIEEPEPAEVPEQLLPFANMDQTPPETPPEAPPEAEVIGEARALRNWLKKRATPKLGDFEADYLTEEQMAEIYLEVKGSPPAKYWTEATTAVAEFIRWAEENDPELALQLGTEL